MWKLNCGLFSSSGKFPELDSSEGANLWRIFAKISVSGLSAQVPEGSVWCSESVTVGFIPVAGKRTEISNFPVKFDICQFREKYFQRFRKITVNLVFLNFSQLN